MPWHKTGAANPDRRGSHTLCVCCYGVCCSHDKEITDNKTLGEMWKKIGLTVAHLSRICITLGASNHVRECQAGSFAHT